MIGDIFHNLFIAPLEYIFEIIFWFLQDHPALAILAISIVMNFLALPLYKRADDIHEEERAKVASMEERVKRIKKAFKGDERYMVLTTYYKEQHYKPIYALKSTFSLLLQIPFFIAAYNFLSTPGLLSGHSLWILKDLGAPDQLLSIGGFSVNVLPIIMTLINVISSYIYLKGSSLRDKIQTYGIAVIFLLLLYSSPSGLVFYWTLNQVFSVLKNIFMKVLKSPKTHHIFFSAAGFCLLALLLISGKLNSPKKLLAGLLLCFICQLPSITALIKKRRPELFEVKKAPKSRYFVLGALFLSILTGLVIPLSVISSSAVEFSTAATDPGMIVLNTFCSCLGVFLIWLGVFYYMAKPFVRQLFNYGILILSGAALLDYMIFSGNTGVLSTTLIYDTFPTYSKMGQLLNLLCILLLAAVLILLMKFLPKVVSYLYIILILGVTVLAAANGVQTVQQLKTAEALQVQNGNPDSYLEKVIPLSKTGKNVIVLMMDRAISLYVPYIMNEKPELLEQFAGFTYYPNMLSFGGHTNLGAPALFGGYEYTPYQFNLKTDQTMAEKHNEALLLMPTLFSEEGYHVTVSDPAYAGYNYYPPDLSIYDDLENVDAIITYERYSGQLLDRFSPFIKEKQIHNFFIYSFMKIAPTCFANTIYNSGNYYSVRATTELSCSYEFLSSYSVLYELPNLTEITEDEVGCVLLMDNDTTHSNTILQTPEYEPVEEVTSDPYADQDRFTLNGVTIPMDNEIRIGHYHANMAAFIQLGRWFDYLREQGVYDNTRIIVVSDHGSQLGQMPELIINRELDVESLNSLLLFKDFDSQAEFNSSDEFMMTADVPYLAMNGLVENMVNPFTGQEITNEVDKEEQLVTNSHNWDITKSPLYQYDVSDGSWWKVHGNVFDASAWEKVENPLE